MSMQLLRLPAVQSLTGLARPTVYLRIKLGLFTSPVKLSARAVAWPRHEVDAINSARIAGRSDDEIKQLVQQLEAARANAA